MSRSKHQQAALRPKMKETSPKKFGMFPNARSSFMTSDNRCVAVSTKPQQRGTRRRATSCHEIEIFPAIDGAEALFPAQPIVWKPGSFYEHDERSPVFCEFGILDQCPKFQ
jgi:hypothetical protein